AHTAVRLFAQCPSALGASGELRTFTHARKDLLAKDPNGLTPRCAGLPRRNTRSGTRLPYPEVGAVHHRSRQHASTPARQHASTAVVPRRLVHALRAGNTSLMSRLRPRVCGKSRQSSLKCRTPRATKGRICSTICSGVPTKSKSFVSCSALTLSPARASASR